MQEIKNSIKKVLQSKLWHHAITGVFCLLILIIVFQVGVLVGMRKGNFAGRYADNYYDNFGTRGMMHPNNLPNAHGTVGRILSIDLPEIVVSDRDQVEKVIVTNEETMVKHARDSIKLEDLKVDDFVIVIGMPGEDGKITAKFIRHMPKPFNK